MENETKPTEVRDQNSGGGAEVEQSAGSGLTRREFVAAVGIGAASLAAGVQTATASSTPIYRIHPAIGVARVGNADPSAFFIGPEIPGQGPLGDAPGTTVPAYKDNGLI